jgi:hypothetical protein
MATVTVTDDLVRIGLSRFERMVGFLRDQEIPLGAIRRVTVEDDPIRALAGLRAPGLNVPRGSRIGTWRGGGRGRRQMVRVRSGQQALRIDAEGLGYATYLVGADDAGALADLISARRAAAG